MRGLCLGLSMTKRTAVAPPLEFVTPDQSLFINGVANTITTSEPASVTADGVSIGSTAGTPAVLSWTPGAVDNDVTLATADDEIKAAAVAADNQSLWTMTGWTLQNLTATAGQADPDGGNNAYKIIATTGVGAQQRRMFKDATSPPAAANSSIQTWISPIGTLLPIWRGYPLGFYAEIKPATGEAFASIDTPNIIASIAVVETHVAGGRTWYRIWERGEWGKTVSTMFNDFLDSFGGSTVDVPSGEHGFYVYRERFVSGALPFYPHQRIMAQSAAAASGVTRFSYVTPFENGTQVIYIEIVAPTSYDGSTPTGLMIVPPVVPNHTYGLANELALTKTNGYADDTNRIWVSFTHETNCLCWGGKKNDGSRDYSSIIRGLPRLLQSLGYNVDVDDIAGIGYSKAGWALLSIQLLWGFFSKLIICDTPYGWVYADGVGGAGTDYQFGDEATFNAHDPAQLMAANHAALAGCEIVLSGEFTFPDQMDGLRTDLDLYSLDYTEAVATMSLHDFTAEWVEPALAVL
jgi:hypothetical protein